MRPSRLPIPPLLRRSELLPGESLPSLLERLACSNFYHHAGVIAWICHERTGDCSRDYFARPRRVQTFRQLAHMTLVSADELFAASDHRFAPVLAPPGQAQTLMSWSDGEPRPMVTSGVVRYQLRSSTTAQFCPLCLQEAAYHHLSWVPIAAAICLEHQCLLVHHCPRCGKRMSVAEIVRRTCQACRADPSTGQPVSVAGDDLGVLSQQVIQWWLSIAPPPELPPGCTLPSRHPAVIYHLLGILCGALLACQDGWPRLPDPLGDLSAQVKQRINPWEKMSPESTYYLFRAAFQGVLNWPQGFHRFLDAYSQRNHEAWTSSTMTGRLGRLGTRLFRKTWRHPENEITESVVQGLHLGGAPHWVEQGLASYLVSRNIPFPQTMINRYRNAPTVAERAGLWTPERAARALSISTNLLNRLFQRKPLTECLPPSSIAGLSLLERDRVLAIKKQWKSGLPMNHVCRWLGLTRWEVVRLVALGALSVEHGSKSDDGADWTFNRQSVVALFETVAENLALYQGHPDDLIFLAEAAFLTHEVGVDSAMLLKGVADGTLPAFKLTRSLPSLFHVRFLDGTVLSLPNLIYAKQGWVSGREFARQKGIPHGAVHMWVRSGLVEPAATFGLFWNYFDARDIEQFADERRLRRVGESQYL